MRNDLKPWDRQPGESEPAYAAFRAFLHMNENNKFRNVSELAKQLSKSRQLLVGWKGKWKWQERADAWDREVLEQEKKTIASERAKMAKNHKAIGRALQSTAIEALKNLNKKGLFFKDIIAAIRVGVMIEMQACDFDFKLKRLELENERLKAETERLRAEIGHKYATDGEYGGDTPVQIYLPEKEPET